MAAVEKLALDSDAARARLDRFRERGGRVPGDQESRRLLAALLESGEFLPGLLLRDPLRLDALAADPFLRSPKPAATVRAEVDAKAAGVTRFPDLQRALRRVRGDEMLRLGARELGWGTTEEVARELSGLADASFEAAVRFCDAQLRAEIGDPAGGERPASFVVVALGKLGGEELNFSSDVDPVYFYSTDAGAAGRGSLHEYYVRLAQRVTQALDEVTDDGIVFRVDLRLRPEGRSGPICNALAAVERYYEAFGRTWERQALLRARPAAGDLALGGEILSLLEPFVHPRTIGPDAVDEIRELRRLYVARDDGEGFDVKVGAGGIRDVELVAQTLQLLHAGKRRDLRERATARALAKLTVAGLLSDREQRALGTAYRFWRRVEHRVQLRDGAQTHRLPADDAERDHLARSLGFADLAAFDAEVARRRAAVSEIAASFDDPGAGLASAAVQRAVDPASPPGRVEAELRALGFRDPLAGAESLDVLRGRMPPEFVSAAAASPDPDRALGSFRELALRSSIGLRALLRGHPQLLHMLATLFGSSEHLSRLLISRPSMWEPFLDGLGEPRRDAASFRAALGERVGGGADEEGALGDLRRFQSEEILRIGLHDVAGSLAASDVSAQLADLADVCVERVVDLVTRPLADRYGRPEAALTVVALGSLGARDTRYGSDLDLVFLYDRNGETAGGMTHQEWFARLAQRVINALGAVMNEGRLYTVDTRLRPSGEQGTLVTSWSAFEKYHRERAAGWERIALLRARPLGAAAERLCEMLRVIVFERPLDEAALRTEVARLRARMRDERGRRSRDARHLRFDPGGLADAEWIAALGQLRGGARDAALRTTSIGAALRRLADRGDLAGPAAALPEHHAFLSQVALRLRLMRDLPDDILHPSDVAPLARSLELPSGALAARLGQAFDQIRSGYGTFAGPN